MGKDTRTLKNTRTYKKKSSKKSSKKSRRNDLSTTEEMRQILDSETDVGSYNGRITNGVLYDSDNQQQSQMFAQQQALMNQQQMMMNQQMMTGMPQQQQLSPSMMDPLMVQVGGPVQNSQSLLNMGMPASMLSPAGGMQNMNGLSNLAQLGNTIPQLGGPMTPVGPMSPMPQPQTIPMPMPVPQQPGIQNLAMLGGGIRRYF